MCETETELVEMCARTHSNLFKSTVFFQRRLSNAMRRVEGIPMDLTSETIPEETWHIGRI